MKKSTLASKQSKYRNRKKQKQAEINNTQKITKRRRTGYMKHNTIKAMSSLKFKIFPVFPNFLRSQVLRSSLTRNATHIPILLYYISSFFYLWRIEIEPVLKHCIVPKYYDQGCSS